MATKKSSINHDYCIVETMDAPLGDELPPGDDVSRSGAPENACRVGVTAHGSPVASILVSRGEEQPTLLDCGLERESLSRVIFLGDLRIAPAAKHEAVLPLLLYAASRRGRLWARTQVAMLAARESSAIDLLALQPLARGETKTANERHSLHAQRIDYATQRAFDRARQRGQAIYPEYLLSEIEERLSTYVEAFLRSKYVRAVMDGKLGREQYVYALSQTHQYVRFTTRVAGHAIAQSPTTELRAHFVRHLRGEVNHELIIERDLEALGADVEYVRGRMAPNVGALQFMSAQGNAVTFHHDPVLMMAAPLAAEVLTAKLPQEFLTALHECAHGWGIEEPRRVTQFLTSHVHADGAEDGHLAGTLAVLASRFTSEENLQSFLSVLELCMDAFLKSYDALVDEVGIWSRPGGSLRHHGVAAAE